MLLYYIKNKVSYAIFLNMPLIYAWVIISDLLNI